jgi:hypothetical protein
MSDEKKPPRDCVELQAINPADGKVWNLLLRHGKMDWVALNRGKGAALELAYTVPWALTHPTAIFRGIREDGEIDGLCYVSNPSRMYHYRSGDERPALPGTVFLIYVDDVGIVYLWRWEKSDLRDESLPANSAARFEERLL